jgi:glyoxylase-like metal-dependent hydrolase (beta-lactamase superfamily II)
MELYAIRYGKAPFKLKYIFMDKAGTEDSVPTDWLFYLAFVNGKTVLFDTGFRDTSDAADWELAFTGYEQELAALLVGLRVDAVVVTHSHFDHIGNLDKYPGSKIIIARGAWQAASVLGPDAVKRLLLEGDVQIIDNELLLEGVLRMKVISGHDAGSSVIYFSSGGKDYLLTGDECYACANILENRPIGSIFHDADNNSAFTLDAHMRKLIPLPFHDKAVLKAYPKVSENIARIV